MTEELAPSALWHVAPRQSELRPAHPGEGDVEIRTLWSLISRGTERLVFEGRVPPSEHATMRAPMQEGDFPFPIKYGYAAVGVVESGPNELLGRHVFALHPHQTRFLLRSTEIIPVPNYIPPRRAALAANMETALNALWDAKIGPGDRVAIIGGGLVGLLVAHLATGVPGCEIVLHDVIAQRGDAAAQLNVNFTTDQIDTHDFDIAIHTSASSEGLSQAIDSLGFEGRLVEMSWYGEGSTAVPLGGAFHQKRLQIVSSQVGAVSPSRRSRWDFARRLRKALQLLDDPALDALITTEVAFSDLADHIGVILAPGADGIATVVKYE